MSEKLLAVDAGNTNVVFAVYDADRLAGRWRMATMVNRTADEYAAWLTQLMGCDGIEPGDVGAAIVACVVPQALHEIRALCRRTFACEPKVVGEGVDLGIEVRIERADEVGADRLANAVAAHARYPGWLIVVDFGTATTLDVVGDDGSYEGGVIAPGVKLSLDALAGAAAKLPRIAVEQPARVIGKSTAQAMRAGVYWGSVGMVEGLVARIKQEVGKPTTVVATGGLAPLLGDATEVIDAVDSDLTLYGLYLIYRRNP